MSKRKAESEIDGCRNNKQQKLETANITSIPDDIMLKICDRLDWKSVVSITSCNRQFHALPPKWTQMGPTLWGHLTSFVMLENKSQEWNQSEEEEYLTLSATMKRIIRTRCPLAKHWAILIFGRICADWRDLNPKISEEIEKYAVCLARDHTDTAILCVPRPRDSGKNKIMNANYPYCQNMFGKLLGFVNSYFKPYDEEQEQDTIERSPTLQGILQETQIIDFVNRVAQDMVATGCRFVPSAFAAMVVFQPFLAQKLFPIMLRANEKATKKKKIWKVNMNIKLNSNGSK